MDGSNLRQWPLAIALLVGGCTSTGTAVQHGGACPDHVVDDCVAKIGDGGSCIELPNPGVRPTRIECSGGFAIVNSCPGSEYAPPGGACTPGDTCEWNTWEHGCSCGCGSAATWDCAPETIGTTECGHDAGI
ncbi:hypothetical protein BH11MYX1_BH11MYX1_25510 [soil metagenome]